MRLVVLRSTPPKTQPGDRTQLKSDLVIKKLKIEKVLKSKGVD